jgi:ketosteroid isomerase-like protein
MKIRLLGALVGLAISFTLPAFAQEKDAASDQQATQKIRAISKAYDEAVNNNDAAAIAALYTEDAVFVSDRGLVKGRQAIEQWYADVFKSGWKPKDHIGHPDGTQPHVFGTMAWEAGQWSETGQDKNGAPVPIKGYYGAVDVRVGEDWKIQMLTYNLTQAPAAPAETK